MSRAHFHALPKSRSRRTRTFGSSIGLQIRQQQKGPIPSRRGVLMKINWTRRHFLERLGVGAAAGVGLSLFQDETGAVPPLGNSLPSRTLGRTGANVSILAFGCGSRFLMYADEAKAQAALNQ